MIGITPIGIRGAFRLGVDAAQQQTSEATLASLLASVKTLNPIYCGQLRGYPACRTVNAAGGRSTTIQSNNGGEIRGRGELPEHLKLYA
jgi:hypothetical protein